MKESNIVFLDMDNVIFDFNQGLIDIVNVRYNRDFTKADALEWNLEDSFGIPGINNIWKEKGFFASLPLLNDAAEWVPKIAESFPTYICSHSPRSAYAEKEVSLERNFGKLFEDRILFTKNKGLARGEFLLDDKLQNLHEFTEAGGEGICYKMAHNCKIGGECSHPISVSSMEEFYHYLKWRIK